MIHLDEVLDKMEPRIRAGFIAMIASMQNVNLSDLETLLEEGRIEEALDLALRSAPNIATASNAAFMAGAQAVAVGIGRELGEITIDFNVTNINAVAAMQRNTLELVTNFTETQRAASRQAIVEGIRAGANPREQALAFRRSIGLTPTQEAAVRNYETALRSASQGALSNKLRNKRNDAAVLRAVAAGEALPESRIARMVAEYRARQIAYRATVIARTEALRSVHEGADTMLQQAIAQGTIESDEIIRTWHTARDERVRGHHRSMHRQIRAVGEPFLSGLGNLLMRPGDSRAPAADVIQCRCRVTIQIRVKVA